MIKQITAPITVKKTSVVAPVQVGIRGKNGASAYDLAVANGFEGTVVDWLLSLKGADGNGTANLGAEMAANKNASGGYAGLVGFAISLYNAAGTILSSLVSLATSPRTWNLPDKDGTVAMLSDITGTNSGVNTGDNSSNSLYSGLVTNATHTGDATGAGALTVVKINGVLMSGLGTGLLKNMTGTGAPSIAVAGTDYLAPNGSAALLTGFPTFNQDTTGTAAKSVNLMGGNGTTLLGAIPYQSGTNTTSFLPPNTTTLKKFMSQTGDGTNGAPPALTTIAVADVAGAEASANKTTSLATDGASDVKYPSAKAVKDYADSLVVGLLDYRGAWSAFSTTFPATGGSGTSGAVMKGDFWVVSVAGTLGGNAIQVGDSFAANVDNPGQTAANWNTFNSNLTYVPEDSAKKDVSGGYAGLTLLKLNLMNAAGTIKSWFVSAATAPRTWNLPDKDGTVAMLSDITGTNSGVNTGNETTASLAALLASAATKSTPASIDFFGFVEYSSGLLKKIPWTSLTQAILTGATLVNKTFVGALVYGESGWDGITVSGTWDVGASTSNNCGLRFVGTSAIAFTVTCSGSSYNQIIMLGLTNDGTASVTISLWSGITWAFTPPTSLVIPPGKKSKFLFLTDTPGSAYTGFVMKDCV